MTIDTLLMSQRWELNPRPTLYESVALPLSYFGDMVCTLLHTTTIYLFARTLCAAANRAIGTRYGEHETYVSPTE